MLHGSAPRPPRFPIWIWLTLVFAIVTIPFVLFVSVPGPAPKTKAPPSPAPSPSPAPVAIPPSASDSAGSHDQVERDVLESESAALEAEKAAIEAEQERIRKERDELDSFERDHPNGVPPELFARYESARAVYNSDVQAFRSRVAAYEMKAADVQRRFDALQR